VDPRIIELTREPPHFAYEAYEFVSDAVTFTQKRLGRARPTSSLVRRYHCRKTDDVGRMVFELIGVGCLSKSDRDSPDDFRDLFDLHQALADGFELTLDERTAVRRGGV